MSETISAISSGISFILTLYAIKKHVDGKDSEAAFWMAFAAWMAL